MRRSQAVGTSIVEDLDRWALSTSIGSS